LALDKPLVENPSLVQVVTGVPRQTLGRWARRPRDERLPTRSRLDILWAMKLWLASVWLVSPVAVLAAVISGGCDDSGNYADVYTCTAPIEDRVDSVGRPDPCCRTEPLCTPLPALEGTTCQCVTPCMEDTKDMTKLAMKCSPIDAGLSCDCLRNGVTVGSCQQAEESDCAVHLSCCAEYLTW
jgi:hypothetical protein